MQISSSSFSLSLSLFHLSHYFLPSNRHHYDLAKVTFFMYKIHVQRTCPRLLIMYSMYYSLETTFFFFLPSLHPYFLLHVANTLATSSVTNTRWIVWMIYKRCSAKPTLLKVSNIFVSLKKYDVFFTMQNVKSPSQPLYWWKIVIVAHLVSSLGQPNRKCLVQIKNRCETKRKFLKEPDGRKTM